MTDVRESVSPDEHKVSIVLRDPYHQPHLQNFFDAVRGKAKLNCPPEIGYESAVSGAQGERRDRGEVLAAVQARGLSRLGWAVVRARIVSFGILSFEWRVLSSEF